MNRPTKIQTTVDFDAIPQLGHNQLREKAFPTLRSALSELNHLISEHAADGVDPETMLHHIDQARKKMYETDLFLQDVQQMVSGYANHQEQEEASPLAEDLAETTQQIKKAVEAVQQVTKQQEGKPNDQEKS